VEMWRVVSGNALNGFATGVAARMDEIRRPFPAAAFVRAYLRTTL
jgi:hypothetical protein